MRTNEGGSAIHQAVIFVSRSQGQQYKQNAVIYYLNDCTELISIDLIGDTTNADDVVNRCTDVIVDVIVNERQYI